MKRILLILFVSGIALKGFATHIVGGGFSLKHLTGTSYELTMHYLGDCINGSPGAFSGDKNQMTIGIFDKSTNIRKNTVQLNFISSKVLSFATDSCAKEAAAGVCTEYYIFRKTITLDPKTYNNTAGYYISWDRCCRNISVLNFVQPLAGNTNGSVGMVFYMEFPPVQFITNSSPYFTSNPNTLLCLGADFSYNMNYKDDDNDELRYSIVDPYNGNLPLGGSGSNGGNPGAGPYNLIQWVKGYSAKDEIHGDPALSIDPVTGQLTVTPTVVGIFGVAIRIEEYRFGLKIGEVRLDLQFTVTSCPNAPPAIATYSDTSTAAQEAYFDVEIPNEICIKIKGNDVHDSVYLKVQSPIFSDTTVTSLPQIDTVSGGFLNINKRMCWKTNCSLNDKGRVPFYLTIRDNGCPSPRSVKKNIYINILGKPPIGPNTILCMTLSNGKTTIYWADSTGDINPNFKQYNIYRGIDYQNFVLIDSIMDKKLRSYTDNNTPNNKSINYTYTMKAVNDCNIEGSVSDTMGTFEQLESLPAVQKLNFVTVTNGDRSIKLTWPKTSERDFAKYYLYKYTGKIINATLLKVYEEPTDTAYQDFMVSVDDSSYCYYVIMRDTCDNYSPYGQPSCSILLKGYSEAETFINNLYWNPYETWDSGVDQYQIMRRTPVTSYQMVNTTNATKTSYLDNKLIQDDGLFLYYVNAIQPTNSISSLPIFESRSNDIQLQLSPIVYAPTAFSANGDNINDSFRWTAIFTKDMNIKVFNRWGQMVYETNDKKAYWDGNVNGAPAQSDVYHYIIYYSGYDGSNQTINGNLTLLR